MDLHARLRPYVDDLLRTVSDETWGTVETGLYLRASSERLRGWRKRGVGPDSFALENGRHAYLRRDVVAWQINHACTRKLTGADVFGWLLTQGRIDHSDLPALISSFARYGK